MRGLKNKERNNGRKKERKKDRTKKKGERKNRRKNVRKNERKNKRENERKKEGTKERRRKRHVPKENLPFFSFHYSKSRTHHMLTKLLSQFQIPEQMLMIALLIAKPLFVAIGCLLVLYQ